MNQKILFGRSTKDLLIALGPILLVSGALLIISNKYLNPAPPNRVVISTSDDEGDYQTYGKLYRDILKEDGITVDLRPSTGAVENLKRLTDAKSDVEVGFVQDGLGSTDDTSDLVSLGSLYYEPIWIF